MSATATLLDGVSPATASAAGREHQADASARPVRAPRPIMSRQVDQLRRAPRGPPSRARHVRMRQGWVRSISNLSSRLVNLTLIRCVP